METLMQPVHRVRAYAQTLRCDFGDRFLMLVVSNYLGVKGFVMHVLWAGMLPFFKKLMHASPVEYQTYMNITTLAFALKSAIGLTSDTFPIHGFHKKYYIMATCVVGVASLIGILMVPSGWPALASILFLFAGLYGATADILIEGKYTELMAATPSSGSSLVSFVWSCVNAGGFMAACLVGPLADFVNPRLVFAIAIPFAVQLVYPVSQGYLMEKVVTARQARKRPVNRPIVILAVSMTIGVFGFLAVSLLQGSMYSKLAYSVASSAVLCLLSHKYYPRMLANANLYMFLKEILYIQITGALDYFYTASTKCLAGGPAFSYTYYQTFTQIVGYAASAVGVSMFQTFLGESTFRRAFCVTIAIKIIASLFDIVMVLRWNVAWGVPDKVMYFFGDAITANLVAMMDFMPAVVLTSKLCPKGYEASVFALLASFQNFGQNVSRSLGGVMMDFFHIRADEETNECDFSGLPLLLIIAHVLIPLLNIPLTFMLIPDANMKDEMSHMTMAAGGVIKNSEDGDSHEDDEDNENGATTTAIELDDMRHELIGDGGDASFDRDVILGMIEERNNRNNNNNNNSILRTQDIMMHPVE
eukprot:PhM_4_TR9530/c0_g1_i1/m.51141